MKKGLPRGRQKTPVPSQSFWAQQLRLLRFYLVTGLLVWIPLIVTLWLTWWLFKNLGLGFENAFKAVFEELRDLGERYRWLAFLQDIRYRPGMGFFGALFTFLVTGILTRYIVGLRIIQYGERTLARIPFVRNVYRAVQQIRDVFVTQGTIFQSVCIIEYPRKGLYAVAFLTSKERGIVQDTLGRDLQAVFLPTTPNPTSGYLFYVPVDEITLLDISVEDAMKLIVSGGAYLPRPGTGQELPVPEPVTTRASRSA